MLLKTNLTLANGVEIPALGFGTWQIPNEIAKRAVLDAIEVGFTHVDTAVVYGNEEGVGDALCETALPRDKIFLTTKIPASIKNAEEAKEEFYRSLSRLKTDYVDLLLIHAPRPWEEMRDGKYRYFDENLAVWKMMEELYREGKCRSIGVSNFQIDDIENLLRGSEIVPHVNQIRVHIGCFPEELIKYCNDKNILVEAYSPNATGRLPENEKVAEIASKYGVSVPQLGIRFDWQKGTLPLPKTTHKEYMIEDAAVDFIISDEDMEILSAL